MKMVEQIAKRELMNTLLVLLVIRHSPSLFTRLHPSSKLNLLVVHLLRERLDCRK